MMSNLAKTNGGRMGFRVRAWSKCDHFITEREHPTMHEAVVDLMREEKRDEVGRVALMDGDKALIRKRI